jgi:hypothetical protein
MKQMMNRGKQVNDQRKQMALANILLHETAHVVLDRAWLRQLYGFRDHTSSGVMQGFPFALKNMPYDDASTKILDYDTSTKGEIKTALGYQWGWY